MGNYDVRYCIVGNSAPDVIKFVDLNAVHHMYACATIIGGS